MLLLEMRLVINRVFVVFFLLISQANAVVGGTFTGAGSALATARKGATSTLLPNGKILVAGGKNSAGTALNTAELYDPQSGLFSVISSPMRAARFSHTATMLPNGKVLITGGNAGGAVSVELYDPLSGANGDFVATPDSLYVDRSDHTATLLSNGKVLIVGGGSVASADLYDPVANTIQLTLLPPVFNRSGHTATLLANGKVLLAGGKNVNVLPQAELYDPTTDRFTSVTMPLITPRYGHSAILLPNGKVLMVAGADGGNNFVTNAELYDPATNVFTATAALNIARYGQTASLLPTGQVLVLGGNNLNGVLRSAEIYDPVAGSFSLVTATMATDRYTFTSCLLSNGSLLIIGGFNGLTLSSAELYNFSTFVVNSTASLQVARSQPTVTRLTDGRVLLTGGSAGQNSALASAEIYDPSNSVFNTTTTPMSSVRSGHSATLLSNGQVLVAGGINAQGFLNSAELYDSTLGNNGSFITINGSLGAARDKHTAALLQDGRVLLAGGRGIGANLDSAELYDPATRRFTATGTLNVARYSATATLLPNGKVLIVGGFGTFAGSDTPLASAELYDPATGTFSITGSLRVPRYQHTATLLVNGQVLITGGTDVSGHALRDAELYDSGAFTATFGRLNTARQLHSATLLSNGQVLLLGGLDEFSATPVLNSIELYDSAKDSFFTVPVSLSSGRYEAISALLPSGKVLIAGGSGYDANNRPYALNSAELFYLDSGIAENSRPLINSVTINFVGQNTALTLGGVGFRGSMQMVAGGVGSEASGGGASTNSATNYPLLQLQRLDNGSQFFAFPDASVLWSDTVYKTTIAAGLPTGNYLATVFVNGIASRAKFFSIPADRIFANDFE